MLWNLLTSKLWNVKPTRRTREINGGRFALGQGCEVLEERRVLSTFRAPAIAEVSVDGSARATQKEAIKETIDTPVGPLEISVHTIGKRVIGKAQLKLNLPENIPFALPPVRFNVALKNGGIDGKFIVRYDDLKVGGRHHRIVGKVTGGEDPNNVDNLAGHIKVKIDGKTLADTDFSIPKDIFSGLLN